MTSDTQRSELPDDIMKAAIAAYTRTCADPVDAIPIIARAILAERNRTPPKVGSGELDAAGLEPPIGQLLRDTGDPEWKQINSLFLANGINTFPIRLRDELSIMLAWARYGEHLAAPVDHPEVVGVKAVSVALKATLFAELGEPDYKLARWAQGAEPWHYWSRESIENALCALAALRPSDSPALEAGVAEARVAKLEEVLGDLISWFDKPSEPEWRIKAGPYGADDAVEAARAALSIPAKEDGQNG